MPLDKFFTSGYRRRSKTREVVAAQHKGRWPQSGQFKATIPLLMRHPKECPAWTHVATLSREESAAEVAAWVENNPGWEFQLKTAGEAVLA